MRRALGIFALLLALGAGVGFAHAADSYQVNSGATTDITEHTVCKKVTNNHASGSPLFVPTKTAPEWSSFYDASLPGVTLGTCVLFGTAISNTAPVCVNGNVWDLAYNSNRLVVAGSFNKVGRCTGGGVPLSTSTGALDISYGSLLQVNGNVNAVVSDGSGGWYIGGDFTTVGSTTRNRLARINSDGTLNSWNPNVNNTIYTMVLSGTTLYIGGSFTTVNGSTGRNRIAAISTTTGTATSWNPNVTSGEVYSMSLLGTVLYIGGNFSSAGGASRYRVAALDTTVNTNNATSWDPNAGSYVYSVLASGSTVYIGGVFTSFTSSERGGVLLSTSTGLKDSSFSSYQTFNNNVNVAIPDGAGGWYVGGDFTTVGGTARNRIARINSDGSLHAFNPGADGTVQSMVLSGNTLYVGGAFTTIGGSSRNRLAALDTTTNTSNATAWDPNVSTASSTVNTMVLSGTTLYIGGTFTTVAGQTRNRIAALDTLTNTSNATAWDPNADGAVNTMLLSSTTMYVGGAFTNIGGSARNRIAALDTSTNTSNATTWNPNASTASSSVNAMVLNGTTLYVGGSFTNIGGATRNRIAALSTGSNTATSWNPSATSGAVFGLSLSGTTLYVGGSFTTIGGQSRSRIAALDTTVNTSNATSWNPSANTGQVSTVTVSGSTVFVGGTFTGFSQSRSRLAAFDTSGNLLSWNPGASSTVNAMALSGTTLYVGGSFSTLGGQSRASIGAVDTTSGSATSWNPSASGGNLKALLVSGSTVYAGGTFKSIGGATRNGLAALDTTTGNASSWDPGIIDDVYAIDISGSTIYVGGKIGAVAGYDRSNIATLDTTSNSLTDWAPPTINNSVKTAELSSNGEKLYIGGDFTTVGGQTRNYIAALDAGTGSVTSWNPGADSSVYTLLTSGNTLYAGGGFSTIGGQSRNLLAALDTTTNTNNATAWNPSATGGTVNTLTLDGTTLYVGGEFTNIGGQARNNVAALDTTVNANNATSWNPNADGGVVSIVVSQTWNWIYLGGYFANAGGASSQGLVLVDKTAGSRIGGSTTTSNGYISAIQEYSGNTNYIGGNYTAVGTSAAYSRSNLAMINDVGTADSWNPSASGAVFTLIRPSGSSNVYVGGMFATVGTKSRPNFAAIDASTGVAE